MNTVNSNFVVLCCVVCSDKKYVYFFICRILLVSSSRLSNMSLALFALCLVSRMSFGVTAGQQCKPAEASVQGKALKGHTFKTSVVRAPFECQVLCENELACQSYNYFLPKKICEINNRTKEARPDDFVPDENSFYMRIWPNRGMVILTRYWEPGPHRATLDYYKINMCKCNDVDVDIHDCKFQYLFHIFIHLFQICKNIAIDIPVLRFCY